MTPETLRYADEDQEREDEKPEQINQEEQFRIYRDNLGRQRTILMSLKDRETIKIVKPADGSRYFPEGRKRIRARIYKALGAWVNVPGIMWSMTYDPSRITLEDAWKNVGKHRRYFLLRLNLWRKRQGYAKLKCLSVIEVQKKSGYPHVHMVFPNLHWLAPFEVAQDCWGHGMCLYTKKDQFSPTAYICKYIGKMEGWDDLSLSYIWKNRTRIYSMSRDYRLPDYAEKRAPEWVFLTTMLDRTLKMRYPELFPYVEPTNMQGDLWN